MKSFSNSIKFTFIFWGVIFLVQNNLQLVNAQGFNNNEWIFGDCGTGQNNILSFGKGEDPIVRNLPQGVILGQNNNVVAIDPITGNIIFYSNGSLVYDANNQVLQGVAPGINGNVNGHQELAVGVLAYDPEGDRLYYIFYLSPSGELQYALIDMNAPGQAVGNEPPLGETVEKDVFISNAQGAILVVKTPSSASYLLSFEGGQLISRRLGDNAGEFTQTDSESLPFVPKAIVFDESSQKLILIPEDDNENILVLDFNTSTGNFSNAQEIEQSATGESFGGAEITSDGAFIYFTRGNEILRVPTDDLSASPESIPLPDDVFGIYDIKLGPDGRLYYIYEEVAGGPQLVGRINNPEEEDLDELEIEHDPFDGTDFCGRIFPNFAPNQSINPNVDFFWDPEEPCANNPFQITSQISPENYRPVSFEWNFTPPLMDEDGNEIDIDFNQEHLLVPQEATTEQSVNVTLTVRFADGSTQTVNKTIPLLPNDLEAQFSAQDTTVCEGPCVDIGSMLEVQSGGGQQPTNLEYFYSNIREWRSSPANCVDLPGLYWVLVREQGSSCYTYASVRVRIWDLPDQSNNVWFFGDGAGLDFNPDPNDPNAPVPRPVSHNQNIPAGTTTISDETGQVLFFTDGESVWDLNGNLMENGEDIGGDNLSTQSVIAVPIPQDETLFYLFTTQRAADGSNQVKFSLVDIKSENPNGVGNVVSKDNFLFSPSTEHSAALAAGDTTWVLFHELGNNTFRAYPVSIFGIGSPVFSSVGSAHGFNTGVGSMKFSPDGSKVAVTIQDGSCSRLEIFDFDRNTGRMTEYALLDLGCNGEDVYGLEFSNDSNRIFVSYTGGGGRVEEFLIQDPTPNGDNTLSCGTCFANANTRQQREECILNSSVRNTLSSAGPFGALQIGPDGQIYVARPGQAVLGSINAGQDCNSSSYTAEGTLPLFGTSNLGLPSFVQQSGSSIPEPALAGTDRLCLDPVQGAIGFFEGGGEPDIDSYFWTIIHEDGTTVLNNFGGPGEAHQELEHLFNRAGNYTVNLRVDRCGDPTFFEDSMEVLVIAPPELTLPQVAVLCAGSPVTLTAIEGYDPAEGLYDFEWRNNIGTIFGDRDSNTIFVNEESIFTVTVSHRRPDNIPEDEFDACPATASIFVGPAFEFDIIQSADEVCYDNEIVIFAPNTPITGEWFYQVQGTNDRVPLGEFFDLELTASTLPGPGIYDIIFITEDPIIENCLIEKVVELIVWPLPLFEIVVLTDSDDCVANNGSFEVTMLADADQLVVVETGQTFTNLTAGQVLPVFTDLEPGIYTLEAFNDVGCTFVNTTVVQNLNPDADLTNYDVELTPEICVPNGTDNGEMRITFLAGPQTGTYTIVNQETGEQFTGAFNNQNDIVVSLPAGFYNIELRDAADCAYPNPDIFEIEARDLVEFSSPGTVRACGVYTFRPRSEQDLIFTVLAQNGNVIQPDDDGNYVLATTGFYTVLGEDPSGILCPRQRTLNLTIDAEIDFFLEGPTVDCETGISYRAGLRNINENRVVFFWRDENDQIVGRDRNFFPQRGGEYSLEVQPREGAPCPSFRLVFVVEDFVNSLPIVLDAVPFCAEDAFTNVTIQGELRFAEEIDWFRVQGGNRIPLPEFQNQESATIFDEGLYEVVITSVYGCVIAREQIQIIQSTTEAPVLLPSYTICAIEEVTFILDPGTFASYEWILDGEVVSTTPTFTPTLPGIYTLQVLDDLGCDFSTTFEVIEDCALKIIFPDAMAPSRPDRLFMVYTNDFVNSIDVFIYNRWGQLIYYCESRNINGEQSVCLWDGTVRGEFVPPGVYPVLVRYSSTRQGITNTVTKSILVID